MASELIERDMYAGKFHVVHNPEARGSQPRYTVDDGSGSKPARPQGVTTILGQTLSKDLMAWAVSCAVEELKGKLPVITQEDLDEAAKAYERKRDSGASTGSEAHAMVENYLKGNPVSSGSPEAQKAYDAFVKWFEASDAKIINVEEVIYSDSFKYAGTYDALMEIDGKVYLTDLKTTNVSRKAPNGIYAEYFIQLGAYAYAHEERRMYEEKNGGTELRPIEGLAVISAKKNGKFDFATNEDLGLSLDDCMTMFLRVCNLNTFLKSTTKLLGGK